MGRVSPKFTTTDKSRAFDAKERENVTILCPAQAFPAPAFRYILLLNILYALNCFSLEPMGSASPKLAWKMIDITEASIYESCTLLCIAQGFPVPIFR